MSQRLGDAERGLEMSTTMKSTEELYHSGQSLWLDNITRDLLTGGTLRLNF